VNRLVSTPKHNLVALGRRRDSHQASKTTMLNSHSTNTIPPHRSPILSFLTVEAPTNISQRTAALLQTPDVTTMIKMIKLITIATVQNARLTHTSADTTFYDVCRLICSTPRDTSSSAVLDAGPSLPFSAASTPPPAAAAAFFAFLRSFSAFLAAAFRATSSFALRASAPPNCSRHSCSFSALIWVKR